MNHLIKNGRVLNPATNTDEILDVLITGGKVTKIEKDLNPAHYPEHQLIDATHCFVTPGLIDIHAHLRDPGLTYKEDMETGTRAAAKGGFTTIVAMANTHPVIDDPDKLKAVQALAKEKSPIQVLQVASLTKDMAGRELTPIGELKQAGVMALSEDGKAVMDDELFRQGLELAKEHNLVVLSHCEDEHLKGDGVYNCGETSKLLGVSGIPNAVEDVMVARDISIATETGAKLHICHCSTRGSVELVRIAKEKGILVTAEVCPHHFILTDRDIKRDDSNYKMAPPLRGEADRIALIQGLQEGTIDVIASDHAPHSEEEKGSDVTAAAFGIVGIETMVALTYTALVRNNILSPLEMVAKMSHNPAQILGLDKGDLQVGKEADITIIDPTAEYIIDKHSFASKGRNTPFHGFHVWGEIKATIVGGEIVYRKER